MLIVLREQTLRLHIKSFNGINTFHEKFKIKFDNLIDNDDSEQNL